MCKFNLTNNYHKTILIIFIILRIYYRSMQKLYKLSEDKLINA